jgi:transcription-repair coupling factor (superfamily II helicase)
MSGPELEKAMRAFRTGETQILLCTSIVESGLDIPNCNTIIITEVEKFGLAQIYQLRGRVGRSDVEAHAYLLYSVGDRMELNPAAEVGGVTS